MNPQLTDAGKFAPGNTLGQLKKPRMVFDSIVREVTQNPEKLKAAVASILDKAADGDLAAMDWIACRLEGKPAQAVQLEDGEGMPALRSIRLVVVSDDRPVIDLPSASVQELPNPLIT